MQRTNESIFEVCYWQKPEMKEKEREKTFYFYGCIAHKSDRPMEGIYPQKVKSQPK